MGEKNYHIYYNISIDFMLRAIILGTIVCHYRCSHNHFEINSSIQLFCFDLYFDTVLHKKSKVNVSRVPSEIWTGRIYSTNGSSFGGRWDHE